MSEAQVVAYQWLDTAHYRKKLPFEAVSQQWRPLVLASDYDQLKGKLDYANQVIDQRHAMLDTLRKQLDEARELLKECMSCDNEARIDAWLAANPA